MDIILRTKKRDYKELKIFFKVTKLRNTKNTVEPKA